MKLTYLISPLLFIAGTFYAHTLPIQKVVLWGHKLHSHTHSYIHEAFYNAFQHLGYDTYWLDNNDDTSHIDFSNSLFITEGQVEDKIPINDTSFYILYNCFRDEKYTQAKENGRVINLQVYLDKYRECFEDNRQIEPCVIVSPSQRIIFMPWATNLLPP